MEDVGRPNIADFFPILHPFDPHGGRARITTYFAKLVKVFDGLLEQRLRLGASTIDYKDLLDSLLSLIKDDQLSRQDVLHLLFVSIFNFYISITNYIFFSCKFRLSPDNQIYHSPPNFFNFFKKIFKLEKKRGLLCFSYYYRGFLGEVKSTNE